MEQISDFQAFAFASSLVALVIYPLVMRLIAERMVGSRIELANIAGRLLKSSELSKDGKSIVQSMIDDSMRWTAMFWASIILPIYIVARKLRLVERVSLPILSDHPHTDEDMKKFCNLYVKSAAAANPIFATILAVEVAVLALIFFPFGMLNVLTETVVRAFVIAEQGKMRFHHS